MAVEFLPRFIREHYEVYEINHASAVLERDFPNEWQDVCELLTEFRLKKSHVTIGGGSKSLVASELDGFLYGRNWVEKSFDTRIQVDGAEMVAPTHSID